MTIVSNRVFATKFGPDITLTKPKRYRTDKNYVQSFSGFDAQTGFNMTDVDKFFGPSVLEVQCTADKNVTEETIQEYINSSIVQNTGPNGRTEYILKQNLKKRVSPPGSSQPPQIHLLLSRNCVRNKPPLPLKEYYYSILFKLDSKLDEKLIFPSIGPGGSAWYSLAEIKTGGYGGNSTAGDFRFNLGVFKDENGLYYKTVGDNAANGLNIVPGISAYNISNPYWRQRTKSGSVKLGVWQKLEVYVKKPYDFSDTKSGIIWCAVTPTNQEQRTVVGHKVGGIQMGCHNLPETRIFLGSNYCGGSSPIVTDFTDLDIRDGLPMLQSERFNNNTMYDF